MSEKNKFIHYLYTVFAKESRGTKFYLCIRVLLIPSSFFTYLRTVAKTYSSILDIGCGYGIITLYCKYLGYQGNIYGLDIDKKRIAMLKDIAINQKRDNVTFEVRDFITQGFAGLSGYEVGILVDILHHLDKKTQEKLLAHLGEQIDAVIIKDIDTRPKRKYYWNFFHDKILMRNDILCFQGSQTIKRIVENAGYTTTISFPKSIFPYPHYLLSGKK